MSVIPPKETDKQELTYGDEKAPPQDASIIPPRQKEAARTLLAYITTYIETSKLKAKSQQTNGMNNVAIIRSSRRYWPRAVDELAETHLVISVDLKGGAGGPPDVEVRDFLAAQFPESTDVFVRYCAFLEALFEVSASFVTYTLSVEPHADREHLAARFRGLMTHDSNRAHFYKRVLKTVDKILEDTPQLNSSQGEAADANKTFRPRITFDTLDKPLLTQRTSSGTPESVDSREEETRAEEMHLPRVILVFDGAESLLVGPRTTVESAPQPDSRRQWSNFGELRRALRGLNGCSLFSLFLYSEENGHKNAPKVDDWTMKYILS